MQVVWGKVLTLIIIIKMKLRKVVVEGPATVTSRGMDRGTKEEPFLILIFS